MILDTPPEHPIQPVLAQKFFTLYLSRPSPAQAGVGKKFFEGIVNSLYFGRLQTKLKAIHDYHFNETSFGCQRENEVCQIFVAYQAWAEDSSLMSTDLHLPSVSPSSKPDKLSLIVHKSEVSLKSFIFTLSRHRTQRWSINCLTGSMKAVS